MTTIPNYPLEQLDLKKKIKHEIPVSVYINIWDTHWFQHSQWLF